MFMHMAEVWTKVAGEEAEGEQQAQPDLNTEQGTRSLYRNSKREARLRLTDFAVKVSA